MQALIKISNFRHSRVGNIVSQTLSTAGKVLRHEE